MIVAHPYQLLSPTFEASGSNIDNLHQYIGRYKEVIKCRGILRKTSDYGSVFNVLKR